MILYLGIDVGVKNLGMCVIDKTEWQSFKEGASKDPGIKFWKVLDTCKQICETCCGTLQNGKECRKKAAWKTSDGRFFCGIHKEDDCKAYKMPKFPKKEILRTIFTELDNIPLLNDIAYVVIETQPRINQKMKMLSACLEAYFTIRQQIDRREEAKLKKISFSSSKNKLKLYDGPFISTGHIKDGYRQRKYLAQKHVEYILREAPQVLEEHFYPVKKKDDLADAFLHCLLAVVK